MPNKEITNKDLASKIDGLTNKIDGLDKKVDGLDENINDLALSVKAGFDNVDNRLEVLENGHEDIKLRLTNVAYRFEFEELERRIILLEKKTGLATRVRKK